MGMFDEINYFDSCPKCGYELSGFQSKDGPCTLESLEPSDVRNFYCVCNKCHVFINYDVKVTDYYVERTIKYERGRDRDRKT